MKFYCLFTLYNGQTGEEFLEIISRQYNYSGGRQFLERSFFGKDIFWKGLFLDLNNDPFRKMAISKIWPFPKNDRFQNVVLHKKQKTIQRKSRFLTCAFLLSSVMSTFFKLAEVIQTKPPQIQVTSILYRLYIIRISKKF